MDHSTLWRKTTLVWGTTIRHNFIDQTRNFPMLQMRSWWHMLGPKPPKIMRPFNRNSKGSYSSTAVTRSKKMGKFREVGPWTARWEKGCSPDPNFPPTWFCHWPFSWEVAVVPCAGNWYRVYWRVGDMGQSYCRRLGFRFFFWRVWCSYRDYPIRWTFRTYAII